MIIDKSNVTVVDGLDDISLNSLSFNNKNSIEFYWFCLSFTRANFCNQIMTVTSSCSRKRQSGLLFSVKKVSVVILSGNISTKNCYTV